MPTATVDERTHRACPSSVRQPPLKSHRFAYTQLVAYDKLPPGADTYYYRDEVAALQVLLEEVTRAKPGSAESRFVRPEGAVIDRLGSRFHHVLFGRRGTGKSSLLRNIEENLKSRGHLVAWADQETFMGLSYPDVLVGTLAEIFTQFARQLHDRVPETPKKRWPKRSPQAAPETLLANRLDQAVAQLLDLKRSPSESDVEWTATYANEVSAKDTREFSAGGTAKWLRAGVESGKESGTRRSDSGGFAHRYRATKSEHLERALTTYRELMIAVSDVSADSFVILDDFYRLPETVQPSIAGYFHRVVKDTGVWLKFGSISYWTRLYAGGSPSVGIQVPHDLRELSLDRGLLDFKTSKRFLEEILVALAKECDVDVAKLFSDGALDRLVLAAGGVPRDYIGLVSESIAVAKNRGPSAKPGTERIIAEDVNTAAGRTADTKFSDMQEDAGGASIHLRDLVIDLTTHCRTTASACFLVNANDESLVKDMRRLQNMRFVHSIASNETLPNQQSNRYHVYVLDVSQLAAQRAWQVDFMGWTKREKRRTRKLIYPSIVSIDDQVIETTTPALDEDLAIVGEID